MRHIHKYIMASVILAASLFATGAAAYAQEGGMPPGVAGTVWKLIEVQRSAQDSVDTNNADVTIQFDTQGQAVGNSTCNSYSAQYTAGAGGALTFEPVISTLRACIDTSLMDLEMEYYRALEAVSSYSYDGANLRLLYNNGSSSLIYSAAETSGPAPGMPRTGAGEANYVAFLGVGALLVLAGVALVASRRVLQER